MLRNVALCQICPSQLKTCHFRDELLKKSCRCRAAALVVFTRIFWISQLWLLGVELLLLIDQIRWFLECCICGHWNNVQIHAFFQCSDPECPIPWISQMSRKISLIPCTKRNIKTKFCRRRYYAFSLPVIGKSTYIFFYYFVLLFI